MYNKTFIIIKVSAPAFGLADNTYLDLEYSGYHKNLIQWLFIIVIIIPGQSKNVNNFNKRN